MARTLQALIFFILSICAGNSLNAQTNGVITDEKSDPVKGAGIFCGADSVVSDKSGRFTIACAADSLIIRAAGFETMTIKAGGNDLSVTLFHLSQELAGAVVISRRMHYFDIGYLPAIKGVQIATGTNSIIETEGQSGAKSSGNARELFAKIPGLNIWESDGAGIQMGVGGRGLSPNRAANFNTRQNGYDISADALGYPESYYTPPLEALSSIEIIRGSASLQYGTQFGGLMNFVIREPSSKRLEFTSRNTVGSFGYYGNFHRVSGTLNRFHYQAYYQLKTGNGYRPNSDFTQHQAFAQVGYDLNENNHIRLEYTRMSYLARQSGGLTDFQFKVDPLQSNRSRNWFNVDWNILALHYDWKPNPKLHINLRSFGMLSSRQSLGFLGSISQADPGGVRDMISGEFKNAGAELRMLKKYSFARENNAGFLIGARYYQGQTTSLQGTATDGDDANFRFRNPDNLEGSDYSFPSKNVSFFVDNVWFFGDRWTVNAGGRVEYISSAASGYYKRYEIHQLTFDTLAIHTQKSNTSLDRFVPLGGVGASFKTSPTTSLYTNVCMNYRAVNFTDIRVVNPNIIVDTLMRDEHGYTAELGWRGSVSKYLYTDAAFFYLFYGDKIGLAPQGSKRIRTNIGDAVNLGVEFFTEWDFVRTFNDSAAVGASIFVNASYIHAEYIRSRETNYIGKAVEYVSPVLIRAGLKLKHERLQVQVQASYNSAQFSDASNSIKPSADAVAGEVPAYFVADFSARYQFKRIFQLEAGINNLTNTSYYTRRATAYPGPGILPSDGRNYYLTLQIKLETKQ